MAQTSMWKVHDLLIQDSSIRHPWITKSRNGPSVSGIVKAAASELIPGGSGPSPCRVLKVLVQCTPTSYDLRNELRKRDTYHESCIQPLLTTMSSQGFGSTYIELRIVRAVLRVVVLKRHPKGQIVRRT